MKKGNMYLLLGIIVLVLFPLSWEIGLYSVLILGIVFLIAFTNEAEKSDGTPDDETATKVKRSAVILISIFLTYRIFLLLFEFWFAPDFYKSWTGEYKTRFWAAHLLIGGSFVLSIFLKKYANDTKTAKRIPLVLNIFALLITISVLALYGYKNFFNEITHVVLPEKDVVTVHKETVHAKHGVWSKEVYLPENKGVNFLHTDADSILILTSKNEVLIATKDAFFYKENHAPFDAGKLHCGETKFMAIEGCPETPVVVTWAE